MIFSRPVTVGATTTLKAIAFESAYTDSSVASSTYTFGPPAATPVFSPAAGTYATAQTVTITSAPSGVSIKYTTDGSTPTETNGTLYSGPVSISSTTMLKAIAYKSGYSDSAVTKGLYRITSSPAVVLNVLWILLQPATEG